MRAAIGTIPGAQDWLTGQAATEHDLDPVFAEDLQKGELYIAVPIALLLLIFTFGTLAFLLPFAVRALHDPDDARDRLDLRQLHGADDLPDEPRLADRARDRDRLLAARSSTASAKSCRQADSKDDAIVRTMATAGRAVVFSGTAVAIGLALLLFMPLPFMRGFGVGGLIIPTVSVLAAVTLLPAMLSSSASGSTGCACCRSACSSGARATSTASGRRSRGRSCAGRSLFAVGRLGDPARARAAGARAPARARVEHGHPAAARGGAGARPAHRGGRGGRARRRANIVVDTGRAGGAGDAEVQAAVARLRSALEADPEVAAVRFDLHGRQYVDATRPLPEHRGGRQGRLRQAGEPRLRHPAARGDRPRAPGSPRRPRSTRAAARPAARTSST